MAAAASNGSLVDNGGITCAPAPSCVACGRSGTLLHEGQVDRMFGTPGTWSTRRCPDPYCGLAWIDPLPLREELGKIYQTHDVAETRASLDAASDFASEPDLDAFRATGRKAAVKRALARALPWLREQFDNDLAYVGALEPGRALDVGCDQGRYLAVLKAAGWDATGIDIDEHGVAQAKAKGLDARVADLRDHPFPEATFDLVTLGNVIEHLPAPAEIFAACFRTLKPGGRLVMITPNIDAVGHDVFGPDWRGLETPRHIYLYSGTSLARFAREAGFHRVRTFSKLRDVAGADFMIRESATIAARAGRTPPSIEASELARREMLPALVGRARGEWVVLRAEK